MFFDTVPQSLLFENSSTCHIGLRYLYSICWWLLLAADGILIFDCYKSKQIVKTVNEKLISTRTYVPTSKHTCPMHSHAYTSLRCNLSHFWVKYQSGGVFLKTLEMSV